MSSAKKVMFAIANVFIGILSVYLYIYVWLILEMVSGIAIHPFWSILAGLALFFMINFIFLRHFRLKEWLIALGIALGSALIFASIFAFS
ncbi:hypothetical protein [Bacillus sp. SG-1]|uniref:hypothetical protein n=1 Tax=Bacillus sp. SG-1 TaxID=161544 RepID=UPI00031F3047|nr:hypothetical protein [Bacillus sp. SG-1]